MLTQELIRRKRNGEELSAEEYRHLFHGFLQGDVKDYQISAFLMACYYSGLTLKETLSLTRIFIESGKKLDLSCIQGVKIDKHSTGGVGDKTSLLLLPIVAGAGVPVPMVSGRGLGHTGGTLDKLESIPGFRTRLSESEFLSNLSRTGMAIMGQTESFVPIDRDVYALRDVTATIDILPLIAVSIMSKKIAVGSDGLVMDVKVGKGAFIENEKKAGEFIELLARIGDEFGLRTKGFLTDMDEPLGRAIGNWLEVVEVVEFLQDRASTDLKEVAYTLAGAMIFLGKKASNVDEGVTIAKEIVRSGIAFEKLKELVGTQGGDIRFIEETLRYPPATHVSEVYAPRDGFVLSIDARKLGVLSVELGAGRRTAEDAIDSTAGIVLERKVGEKVTEGAVLCRLYSSQQNSLARFRKTAGRAFTIGESAPESKGKVLRSFGFEKEKERMIRDEA